MPVEEQLELALHLSSDGWFRSETCQMVCHASEVYCIQVDHRGIPWAETEVPLSRLLPLEGEYETLANRLRSAGVAIYVHKGDYGFPRITVNQRVVEYLQMW